MQPHLRGDENGIFWNEPVFVREGVGPRIPPPGLLKGLIERPGPRWTLPTQLPQIRGRVKQLCIDLETKDEDIGNLGPGPRRPHTHIAGIAVGLDLDGPRVYLPIQHGEGPNLDKNTVIAWAKEELQTFDGELIGAKLDYDLDWLCNIGITFPQVKAFHDIQIAEPLLNEWRQHFDLDSLSWEYLGQGKDQGLLNHAAQVYGFGQSESAVKRYLHTLSPEYVGAYAEADVDRPLRIWHKQKPRLEAENLMQVYEIERKLIPLLVRMRRRGVRINVKRAEEVSRDIERRIASMEEGLRRLAGPKASFSNGQTLVPALLDRGIKLYPTEKSRFLPPDKQRLSVTKQVFEAHQTDPLCALILNGRKLMTLDRTFMKGHILGHNIDGRIHCSFNQLKGDEGGTIARFSSSDPNLQNIPSRDPELAPLIRSIFIPEGRWDRLDESQIEYRLLVNYARGAGAEEARERYRRDPDTDFHIMCGNFLHADATDTYVRKRVKNLNFCKVYGGGVPKIAATFGCSLAEAQEFTNLYDRELPFVRATHEAAMHWAARRGFIVTLLNRKQRFSLWEPAGNYERRYPALPEKEARESYGPRVVRAFLYAALNRKLQASAADVMKKGMVDADAAGLFADDVLGAPLLTVHDELDVDNPLTPRGQIAVEELRQILETGFIDQLKIPLRCDHSFGSTWGEAS